MVEAVTLRKNNVIDNLLAEQPFVIKDKNGNEIAVFGMELGAEIAKEYERAELQNYLFETYYDFKYSYEELANIAEKVLEKMEDSHISEESAIEWAMFEDEPCFLYEDAKKLATYVVRGHGAGDEDSPSGHLFNRERLSHFDTIDECRAFNPFIAVVDGESEEIGYREAIATYGAKIVDAFIREIDDTNMKYVEIFEDICERICGLDCKIDGLNISKAYTTGLDRENGCVGIQIELVNEEGDVWDAVDCQGYFVGGKPFIEMDDGSSFIDDFIDLAHERDYVLTGIKPHAPLYYLANGRGKSAGIDGIIIPVGETAVDLSTGEQMREFLNDLADKHLLCAVHYDREEDSVSYVSGLRALPVNIYGYMVGSVGVKMEGDWHVDLKPEWFDKCSISDFDTFKKQVEGYAYGKQD